MLVNWLKQFQPLHSHSTWSKISHPSCPVTKKPSSSKVPANLQPHLSSQNWIRYPFPQPNPFPTPSQVKQWSSKPITVERRRAVPGVGRVCLPGPPKADPPSVGEAEGRAVREKTQCPPQQPSWQKNLLPTSSQPMNMGLLNQAVKHVCGFFI